MPSAGAARSGCPAVFAARRGFTLVELLAVVIILSILAGVAIPKFMDYQAQARESVCKGTLSGVRAGMANYLVDSSFNGTPAYPAFADLFVVGLVMQEEIPPNPYTGNAGVNFLGLGDSIARSVLANTKGWNYYVNNAANPPVAVFWANSNSVGENQW